MDLSPGEDPVVARRFAAILQGRDPVAVSLV